MPNYERAEKAKALKAQGLNYKEIAAELGVSPTMARNYVLDLPGSRPGSNSRENGPYRCNLTGKNKLRCERTAGHDGVHLARGKKGLVYWI